LQSVTDFPTRITNSSSTAIDNIFLNKHKSKDFSIQPRPNRLSDHDSQILTLHDIKIQNPATHYLTRRIINDSTISEFQLNLSYKSRDNVFNGDNVDAIFNNFLNTYLRIFYHTFPLKKCQYNNNYSPWTTPGIKISSQHKRELYLLCRSTKDPKLKTYYKNTIGFYQRSLNLLKKLYYNNLIINSNNKPKISWHIIKSETNKAKCNHDISSIVIDGKICNDYLDIAKALMHIFQQ
jgi:hypothetical protein